LSGLRRINKTPGLSPANISDFPACKAGEYDFCPNALKKKKAEWLVG